MREVVESRRRTLGDDGPELASGESELTTILNLEGKYDEAEKAEEEALAIRRRLYGNRHRDVAESVYNLASIANEGKPLLLEARATREANLGAEHEDTRKAALELEKLYQAWGKPPPTKR